MFSSSVAKFAKYSHMGGKKGGQKLQKKHFLPEQNIAHAQSKVLTRFQAKLSGLFTLFWTKRTKIDVFVLICNQTITKRTKPRPGFSSDYTLIKAVNGPKYLWHAVFTISKRLKPSHWLICWWSTTAFNQTVQILKIYSILNEITLLDLEWIDWILPLNHHQYSNSAFVKWRLGAERPRGHPKSGLDPLGSKYHHKIGA